jgi:hypothetical protein
MLTRALVRNGLPAAMARQYAQQAVDNAKSGAVAGTMAKVMAKFKSLTGMPKPDKPESGGAS